jgi:hypothetical protein
LANGRRLAPDAGLDRIELGDAPQRFGRDWRPGRLLHLIKLAPGMRPAARQPDIARPGQSPESGIAVDQNDALELR